MKELIQLLIRALNHASRFAASVLCILLQGVANADEAEALHAATHFLEEHRVYSGQPTTHVDLDVIRNAISSKADPGTKLHPYVFALAGRHKDLLAKDQQARVAKILQSRRDSVDWHDARNIIRVRAQMKMWEYAGSMDQHSSLKLREQWAAWTDLRLSFMFQEFVARERFQRQMWDVYTAQQRLKISSGEWSKYVKKNVGHKRLFSADKQTRRALGPADDQVAFDRASDLWRVEWDAVLKAYHRTSQFDRKREFAMDEADESFAIAIWKDTEIAFRLFAESECEAIREVVQSGYHSSANRDQKVAAYIGQLKSEMIAKYGVNTVTKVIGSDLK